MEDARITDPLMIETPIEVTPTGSPRRNAHKLIDGPNRKPIKKNFTESKINPARYASIIEYLEEFYHQSMTHKTRKGYDQHWNSEGFIHAGPAIRLPNRGAANMLCFLIDILSDRIVNSTNKDVANDALAYYNICLEFMQSCIAERKEELERDILAAAASIQTNT